VFVSRQHRMHDMRNIVIDDPGRLSVGRSGRRLRCVNTAKRIKVFLREKTVWGAKEYCVRRRTRFALCIRQVSVNYQEDH